MIGQKILEITGIVFVTALILGFFFNLSGNEEKDNSFCMVRGSGFTGNEEASCGNEDSTCLH